MGSLNLEVATKKHAVSIQLQSPVNKEAKPCLDDGMRGFSLSGTGEGTAMVLLSMEKVPAISR